MSGYNYLNTFSGAWSSTTTYKIQNITGAAQIGLGYVSCPQVTDAGSLWVANGSVQPTFGTHPAANTTAWTLVQTGIVYNASAPVVGNDNTQGYAVGTLWVDTANNTIYYCVSNATGAATWTATVA